MERIYILSMRVVIFTSITFFAQSCKEGSQTLPGEPITPQAVYTKDDPGNWAGKEDEHTPKVEILSKNGHDNIRVTVTLNDASPTHYIEKIFIADSKGRPVKEEIFTNTHEKTYTAGFTLPVNSQTTREYAVYARCSQHDLWSAPIQ